MILLYNKRTKFWTVSKKLWLKIWLFYNENHQLFYPKLTCLSYSLMTQRELNVLPSKLSIISMLRLNSEITGQYRYNSRPL